jgi:calcineurin-like phosphoesterase family protein
MIETWFTSDTHFGHKNILEYEKESRPFKTLEEMHDVLINNWNNTVGKNDIVYHLGDFAFGRGNIGIASKLNGRKKLIMGNHDAYPSILYLDHFESLFGCYYWRRCVLSHIPVHPESLGTRAILNIHGHYHSKFVKKNEIYITEGKFFPEIVLIKDENYFNVSVELHNLTPVHSDIIMERLKELE